MTTGCHWLCAAHTGTSSSTFDTDPAAIKRKPRLTRRQQLQAQAGVQKAATQAPCTSDASMQVSGAASQSSACVNQRPSHPAAGCQAQGGLQHLAAQLGQQNAHQSTDSGGSQGIRLARSGSALRKCPELL